MWRSGEAEKRSQSTSITCVQCTSPEEGTCTAGDPEDEMCIAMRGSAQATWDALRDTLYEEMSNGCLASLKPTAKAECKHGHMFADSLVPVAKKLMEGASEAELASADMEPLRNIVSPDPTTEDDQEA